MEGVSVDAIAAQVMRDAQFVPEGVRKSTLQDCENLDQPKYQTIAYLAASGKNPDEIAAVVALKPSTIATLLRSDRMKFEVKHLRYKLYGKDAQKRFRDLLPQAIDVTEQVMCDESAKPATKLEAAKEVFDRAMGRPKQTMEIGGSLIRTLLEKLDGKEGGVSEILDVSPVPSTFDSQIPEYKENPNEFVKQEEIDRRYTVKKDDIDKWADENL